MYGNSREPGLAPRTMARIYELIAEQKAKLVYTVKVTAELWLCTSLREASASLSSVLPAITDTRLCPHSRSDIGASSPFSHGRLKFAALAPSSRSS